MLYSKCFQGSIRSSKSLPSEFLFLVIQKIPTSVGLKIRLLVLEYYLKILAHVYCKILRLCFKIVTLSFDVYLKLNSMICYKEQGI